jgi:hypothetical protein
MRAAAGGLRSPAATTCQRKPVEVRDDHFPHSISAMARALLVNPWRRA